MRIPTVIVDRGGKAVTINEKDFREGRDTLWSNRTQKKVTKKKARKK